MCLNAQALQSGIVKEYNEELAKTPLANVDIRVYDAGLRVSGEDGTFVLRFRTKKVGDHVNVDEISKFGYEIFNKEAIEQWNISGEGRPFTIVMCRSDLFKKIKDSYSRIASENFKKQFDKEQFYVGFKSKSPHSVD